MHISRSLNQLPPAAYAHLRVTADDHLIADSVLAIFSQPRFFMKPGTITHTVAVLLSSVTSLFAQSAAVKPTQVKMKASKKSNPFLGGRFLNVDSSAPSRVTISGRQTQA